VTYVLAIVLTLYFVFVRSGMAQLTTDFLANDQRADSQASFGSGASEREGVAPDLTSPCRKAGMRVEIVSHR
jgi:hypothetical protein